MATTKSTRQKTMASSASTPRSTSVAAHSHADLESKVAELEKRLAAALSAVTKLESRVQACENTPAAAGGRDEDLRDQLRNYFSTSTNRKVPTRFPKI